MGAHPDAPQAVAVVEVCALGVQQQRCAAIGKVRPRTCRLRVPRILAHLRKLCGLSL